MASSNSNTSAAAVARKWNRQRMPRASDIRGSHPDLDTSDDNLLALLKIKRTRKATVPVDSSVMMEQDVSFVPPKNRFLGKDTPVGVSNSQFDPSFWYKDFCYQIKNFRLRRNVWILNPEEGEFANKYYYVHVLSTSGSNQGEKFRLRFQEIDMLIKSLSMLKEDIQSSIDFDTSIREAVVLDEEQDEEQEQEGESGESGESSVKKKK